MNTYLSITYQLYGTIVLYCYIGSGFTFCVENTELMYSVSGRVHEVSKREMNEIEGGNKTFGLQKRGTEKGRREIITIAHL